jgi:predicted TIM-barrel fold metal-dependent hydrolase
MRWIYFTSMLVVTSSAQAQTPPRRLPIIDMHLHSNWWSVPGDSQAAQDALQLRRATLQALERYNIVLAVTSGVELLDYKAAAPDRILMGLRDLTDPVDSIRAWAAAGRLDVIAEFTPQYDGIAPDSSALEPYFALAEELDLPIGIHIGLGPPGAAYCCAPKYRMRLSNPLLLEDVLVRHPKLRLYVMHAGWPMLDAMLGLLWAHPQVYVDVGVIDWALPRPEFHAYLRRLVEAGFEKRIMFGSDQMVWPHTIQTAIENIESAAFLSTDQKRDIFYNNAARFLRLDSRGKNRQ